MKQMIGLTVAAVLVLLQLGVVAAWSAEPPLDLSPVHGPEFVQTERA